MATTLLILVLAWLVTVPLVLGLARLLGRLTAPKLPVRAEPPPRSGPDDRVVPLVPHGRNGLAATGGSRRAA